jgi:hypothetical protein
VRVREKLTWRGGSGAVRWHQPKARRQQGHLWPIGPVYAHANTNRNTESLRETAKKTVTSYVIKMKQIRKENSCASLSLRLAL